MKKWLAFLLTVVLIFTLAACSRAGSTETIASRDDETTKKNDIQHTFTGNLETYYELSDGTWQCKGLTYQYRLELTGTIPNAATASTFVYLSNLEHISFDQAYLAAGISSNTEDYFSPDEAVLVEWITQ